MLRFNDAVSQAFVMYGIAIRVRKVAVVGCYRIENAIAGSPVFSPRAGEYRLFHSLDNVESWLRDNDAEEV